GAPGDVLAGEVDVICKMVQLYCLNEIRLTQSQTLLLPYVCIVNMKKVFQGKLLVYKWLPSECIWSQNTIALINISAGKETLMLNFS
ncbi:hypothetical protein, partial [Candidatus Hodgkinia cicadicola]|uniref:hypothetical protein n=1 Tax=Candidatus Hodgkinia cicadicola TaxID=573658 RepID=UPI0011BABB78